MQVLKMTNRRSHSVVERRLWQAFGWLAAAATLSCSDSPTGPDQPGIQTPFVASTSRANLQHPVYFSLRAGSVPSGGAALLRVMRTGASTATELIEGGFDPVALLAIVGDTVEVSITMTNGSPTVSFKVAVTRPAPPVIVRTQPPKQKRDVALNSPLKVVFSEPVDSATVTSSAILLRTNGHVVSGRLQFADDAHTSVEFVPNAGLESETDYELVVTRAVKDLDGAPLEAALTVPFRTAIGVLAFSIQPIMSVVMHSSGTPAVRLVTQVMARTSSGAIATGFTGDVTVSLATGTAGGRVWGTTTVRAVDGIATFLDLYMNAVGAGHALVATSPSFGPTTSTPFNAGGGMVFMVAPTQVFAGVSIAPVEVVAEDAAGNHVSGFARPLTLSLASGAAGVTLHGTTVVAAGFGRAVFTDLQINEVAPSIQFLVTSEGIADATSAAFSVDRIRLDFAGLPARAPLGVTMELVSVRAIDLSGNVITRFTGDVTIALGRSPSGASLLGTRTVRAVGGVAKFTDLQLNMAGQDYTLIATANCCDASVEGGPLDVVTSRLEFTAQPSTTNSIATIAPIKVEVRDLQGSPIGYDGLVTLEIVQNPSGGRLSGTTTVAAVNGVATFSDLSIDASGIGYTLGAIASGTLDAVSAPFNILSEWVASAAMPTARTGLGVGVIDGVLYAVGGDASGGYSNPVATLEAYDPASNRWATKASMPTAREYFGVGVVNGILYAIGGRTGTGANTGVVEAYNPATDKWTTRAPMPNQRYGHSVAVANGIIYAVGESFGYDGAAATVAAYDPATNVWTTKAEMAYGRAFLGLSEVNGLLYAVGGENDGIIADVDVYDPATNSWAARASMNTARSAFASVTVNNVIYAISGWSTSLVEGYEPATNRWVPKPSMPSVRYHFAAGVIDGVIHVVGGVTTGPSAQITAEHLTYRP